MKIITIIPARGGSKGVPGKNIKMLGDKPLLLHAADCALGSKYQMDIVVSTDNYEIERICLAHDLKVIKRPSDLATDSSLVVTAIQHVMDNSEIQYDLIVLLQATSPFRTSAQLDEIIEVFKRDISVDGVISVVEVADSHPSRMYNVDLTRRMESYLSDETETARRQDLEPLYLRNGCFYAVRTAAFFRENSVMPKNKKAFVMDSKWHVNIDNPIDFKLAELVYKEWSDQQNRV